MRPCLLVDRSDAVPSVIMADIGASLVEAIVIGEK